MEKTLKALSNTLNTATQAVIAATLDVFEAGGKLIKAKDDLAALMNWKDLGSNDDQRRASLVRIASDNPNNDLGHAAKAILTAQAAQEQAEQRLTIANHVLDNERAQLRLLEAVVKVRDLAEVRKGGK